MANQSEAINRSRTTDLGCHLLQRYNNIAMAESVENSSSEESENSDFYDVYSADLSTSSTSSSEEESISNRAKGKAAAAKKTKTTKGNASTANAKIARPKKNKKADNSLNANEMDDLSTWICSSEEVNKVEQNLRLNLVKDARINKGDRKRLVERTFIVRYWNAKLSFVVEWVLSEVFYPGAGSIQQQHCNLQESGFLDCMDEVSVQLPSWKDNTGANDRGEASKEFKRSVWCTLRSWRFKVAQNSFLFFREL